MTPVVLVSPVVRENGRFKPIVSAKLANYVNTAILRYPANGFLYYETIPRKDCVPIVKEVVFECYGPCSHRMALFCPMDRFSSAEQFQMVIGQEVEW